MADVAYSHPELARRWHLLVERCWSLGWDVWIVSSSRSEATQRLWYAMYLAGQFPNIVADPDRDAGATPWGWRARGSLHMVQRDGYSHALDIGWAGPSPAGLHALANTCGLRFPEPTENWHAQAFDAFSGGLYPVTENPPPEVHPMPDYLLRSPIEGEPVLAVYPDGALRHIGGDEGEFLKQLFVVVENDRAGYLRAVRQSGSEWTGA